MLTNRFRCTAHSSSRSGFTLVELLVVIGIIAILAGVALGPITNGIKKAKQSSGMQAGHALYIASFAYSNDNNQVYAFGTDASNVAIALLGGSYVTDASIFYISGGTATKYTGSAPLTGLKQTNISWDFNQKTATAGLDSSYGSYVPLLWSSLNTTGGGVEPVTAAATLPMTATPGAQNPFQTAGAAVAYLSGASKFIPSTYNGTAYSITMVSAGDDVNGIGTIAPALGGG